jgi:hypothetical protein
MRAPCPRSRRWVLMVWVYDRTGSVFGAMLMHVSLTASLLTLNPVDITGAHLLTYCFALACALWIVVAVAALTHRGEVLGITSVAGRAHVGG